MSMTSVRLDDNLESLLSIAVKDMRRSKGWIINEALRLFLSQQALEQQRWEQTLEALEDIRMGRVVDGDKVHAWLESWGTDHEKPRPKIKK
jgi:predicted transcriptional regulator